MSKENKDSEKVGNKKRKLDTTETKAPVDQGAVMSKQHMTNYMQWTLATAAESKSTWFKLCTHDQKTGVVTAIDPTQYKAEKLVAPNEVPSQYVELVGSTLLKGHQDWMKLKYENPGLAEIRYLINECRADFIAGQYGFAQCSNAPTRYMTPDFAEKLAKDGKFTTDFKPSTDTVTIDVAGKQETLTVPRV